MKPNIDIKAREVAYGLSSEILKAQKTPLPEKLTVKDILREKYKYRILLISFSTTLHVALIFNGQNQQIKLEELNQLVKMRFL